MAHPHLVSAADTGLLVIDVQEKLFHMVARHEVVERDMLFMIDAARAVQLPILATEQYPKGLGGTIASIAGKISGTGRTNSASVVAAIRKLSHSSSVKFDPN
ncbi:MAG: hypothetical protein QM703_06590 [Gemmatales bacterium]